MLGFIIGPEGAPDGDGDGDGDGDSDGDGDGDGDDDGDGGFVVGRREFLHGVTGMLEKCHHSAALVLHECHLCVTEVFSSYSIGDTKVFYLPVRVCFQCYQPTPDITKESNSVIREQQHNNNTVTSEISVTELLYLPICVCFQCCQHTLDVLRVNMVFQWCYSCVNMVLQWCYSSDVTMLPTHAGCSWWAPWEYCIAVLLQECYNIATHAINNTVTAL
jgi:hypothetical protein